MQVSDIQYTGYYLIGLIKSFTNWVNDNGFMANQTKKLISTTEEYTGLQLTLHFTAKVTDSNDISLYTRYVFLSMFLLFYKKIKCLYSVHIIPNLAPTCFRLAYLFYKKAYYWRKISELSIYCDIWIRKVVTIPPQLCESSNNLRSKDWPANTYYI